jgi:hypothetical protein
MAEQSFYRDRLKALATETEAQRKALEDAESRRIEALEKTQAADDLASMREAIAEEQTARISEGVAKTILIAALEAELHVVKMMLEANHGNA